MGRMAYWATVLGLLGAGCTSPCTDVAALLRQCCAKGPAELRQSCEAEARSLEEDGNSEACQAALDEHKLEGCRR